MAADRMYPEDFITGEKYDIGGVTGTYKGYDDEDETLIFEVVGDPCPYVTVDDEIRDVNIVKFNPPIWATPFID